MAVDQKYEGSFTKVTGLILEAVIPIIDKLREDPELCKRVNADIVNTVLGEEKAAFHQYPKISEAQKFTMDFFYKWGDIGSVMERLLLTERFLSLRIPTSVSPEEYLQYHCETHLQNSYILFDRLRHIYKLYKKSPIYCRNTDEKLDHFLHENFINTGKKLRNVHVHQYLIDIQEIKRIGLINTLTLQGNVYDHISHNEETLALKKHEKLAIKDAKSTLEKKIKRKNEFYKQCLDIFSYVLEERIFVNGELLTPYT